MFCENRSKKLNTASSSAPIVFAKKFSPKYISRISLRYAFFASFIFAKNAKFREKVCEKQKKIFAFFRKTFRSLQTLDSYICKYKYNYLSL